MILPEELNSAHFKIEAAQRSVSEMLLIAYKAYDSGRDVTEQAKRLDAISQALNAAKTAVRMCEHMVVAFDTLKMSVQFIETMWDAEQSGMDSKDINVHQRLTEIMREVDETTISEL